MSSEIRCWRRVLQIRWTTRKMNKWVLEHIKPETLLETKTTKPKLPRFGHVMRRQGSWERRIELRNGRQQEEEEQVPDGLTPLKKP